MDNLKNLDCLNKMNRYFNLDKNKNVHSITEINNINDKINYDTDLLYINIENDNNLLNVLNGNIDSYKYIVIDNIKESFLQLYVINFLLDAKFKLIKELKSSDLCLSIAFRNKRVKKIAFHIYFYCERGTSTALYDYANYAEKILGYESIIISPLYHYQKNIEKAYEKFNKRFKNFTYTDANNMEDILKKEGCDILYVIKHGQNDGVYSKKIKTCIHCVFDMTQPHGDIYAGVSQQISSKYGKNIYVPHMVDDPSDNKENFRNILGIPENATVFGYHGGSDSFNIHFAINTIKQISRLYPHIYFIFLNIPRFDKHNCRLIFLPKIIDIDEKNKFINTCDCCLEAQSLGQSFGLSLAEFSVNNKPIITYGGFVMNDNYRKILGNNAMYYKNEKELTNLILNFKKEDFKGKDLNCYKEYNPTNVMNIFKNVFC